MMGAFGLITLKQVAKECGVSITQASRALNNFSDVSEKTKLHVKQTAQRLGYVKNVAAQNLATGSSNQVAYIVVGIQDDHNSNEYSNIYPIMRGINDFIITTEFELAVYFFKPSSVSYLEFARKKGLAGIILSGLNYDDPNLKELLNSDLPCVLLDIPVLNYNKKGCVVINNALQASTCVEKLIEIGKKNIIMITGHLHAMVSLERETGFKTALIMNNMPFCEERIFRADFDEKIASEITYEVLKQFPQVDGIFCASDFMAIGCMKTLLAQGKRIPQDVAVIGFDGIPQGRYVTPTLTTIGQDNYQNGYCSAKLLNDFLTDADISSHTITLNCKLIERDSTKIVDKS